MIKKYLSKKSKNFYLIGFYKPEDFYIAHLLEHCITIELGRHGAVDLKESNIGSGYIFIFGKILSFNKIKQLLENKIFQSEVIVHQKKILISEKIYKDRLNPIREIYESLETNSSTQKDKEAIFNEFINLKGDKLTKRINEVAKNIHWLALDEKFQEDILKREVDNFPKIKEKIFIDKEKTGTTDFEYAEIDLLVPACNKIDDFINYLLNRRIYNQVQNRHIVYGTHTIYNSLGKTRHNKNLVHYSCYLPREYAEEFFEFIEEEWKNATLNSSEKIELKKICRDYLLNRTAEQRMQEIIEHRNFLKEDYKIPKCSKVNLKIYKKLSPVHI